MSFGSCDQCLAALKKDILITKQFLNTYTWLTEAYISDYFTHELWKNVEQKWWTALSVLGPPELATFLSTKTWNVQTVWPLSLLAFRAAALGLALDRNPKTIRESIACKLSSNTCSVHYGQSADFQPSNPSDVNLNNGRTCPKARIRDGQHELLEHCYRRHVKPKKQHEILNLSQVVNIIADHTKCTNVVDIGAGQGHLSRILHFGYGLNVTTVEASGCHAPKAQKYDEEVQKDIIKGQVKKSKESITSTTQAGTSDGDKDNEPKETMKPTHVVGWIDSNVSVPEFLHQVQLSQCGNDVDENECTHTDKSTEQDGNTVLTRNKHVCDTTDCDITNFIMTGLHACGDLTPTMMRVFVNCTCACSLISVACCYHKLTPDSERDSQTGYPMSSFLKNDVDHNLSWETREMACHFVDQYHSRLLDNPVALRSHAYRAALQEIIRDKNPDIEHGSIKLTLKKAHDLPFPQYAAKALSRLNMDTTLTDEQISRAHEKINRYKEVVAFYTLRLTLAPVIEKLILLDRICYLAEQGINSTLVPIFDPQLSPRNFVLLAVKPRV